MEQRNEPIVFTSDVERDESGRVEKVFEHGTFEPKTAEIVNALRCNPENSCLGCPYCITVSWCQEDGTADTDCNDKVLYYDAADRLEQLERENAELRESNGRFAQAVSELTIQAGAAITRAEKAEAERNH